MGSRREGRRWAKRTWIEIGAVTLLVLAAPFVFVFAKRVAQRSLPCPGVAAALRALDPPAHLDVYVSHFDAKTSAIGAELEALARAYATADARVTYSVHETDSTEGLAAARNAGIYPSTIPSPISSATMALGEFASGMVISSGASRAWVEISERTPERGLRDLDLKARRALRRLRLGRPVRVGVMPGAEASTSSAQPFHSSADSCDLVPIDPLKPIDSSLDGLLVFASHTYEDAAVREVDAFLMKGKPVVFVGGAADVRYGTLTRLTLSGMHALVAKYGVVVHSDLVFDFDDGRPPDPTSPYAGWSFFARPEDGERSLGSPLFAHADMAVFMTPSSVELSAGAQPHARARIVARTSDRGYALIRVGTRLADWSPLSIGLQPCPYDVAAEIEGPITSAYGLGDSAAGARVLVVAGWLRDSTDLHAWLGNDDEARSCGEGTLRP